MRDCQYCKTRNLERDEPHIYGCPGLTIERLRDQRTVLCEQLTDKCDELKAASVEIEQMRTALENIAALDYTKAATTGACALAVRIAKEALPTKSSDPEYPRASDARGPTQTQEKAESSRHQGSDDACADRNHRASDSGRLQLEKGSD